MNRLIFSIVMCLMALSNPLTAADKVSINDFLITPEVTKSFAISMDNDLDYAAFQFDLYLPQGITIISYSADRSRLPKNTSLQMEQQADGGYRFIAVANDMKPITGTSGSIITITVAASANTATGNHTGYFRNIKLSKTNGEGNSYEEMTFPVNVVAPSVVTAKSYTRAYGDDNPTFEYTVEGGALVGTPSITCSATVKSPVNTYDKAISKGTVQNDIVTYVKGTLTVEQAPLTISGGTYTMKQGDPMPTFTPSYSGFKNNETETVLKKKPTLTTTATSASEPGTYDIIVAGAEAQNYAITYVKGTLTITQADPVTITAKSYTRAYGEPNPVFEYTTEGAPLTGTPAITCAATASSPVGTYDIVVSQGTVSNYNVTYVAGTLTIEPAPLTVSVEDATRYEGEENPEFQITYDGWKLNDTESVLTEKPVATTEATKDSPVGEYVIVVSGGKAQNYALTYQNGTLTITEKPFAKGDVNGDGQVGIADIVAVTNVMAGITTDEATVSRADVNGDSQVGIADIVAITNIMAGK